MPWRRGIAALALLAATLAVFAPAFHFRFVDLDDGLYVTEVPMVQRGLTVEGMRWAFTTFHAMGWQPLTWLSLMTDVELFGGEPEFLHGTSIALHAANVLLLFAILGSATRAWGRSFFVAGLFATHPLHVESVAWISERKDVLSTFFGLLAIGAYLRYARRPSPWRYAGTCGLFVLSLSAKPTLVTLPLLLLLLDVWPLERLPWPFGANASSTPPMTFRFWTRLAAPRLLEKLPLLAFSLGSSLIAYRAQSYGGTINEALPALVRDANALVSLLRYLEKTAFPLNLAAYYPYAKVLGLGEALACGMILTLLTVAACRVGTRTLYLPVGWLWYLVAMLPVIGFVQIGSQSIADRYTYVPLVGIFVVVVWGADALRERLQLAPGGLAALGAALLVGLGLLAHRQVMVWQDTRTLFAHAIAVTGGSSLAYVGLGTAEFREGHLEAAAADFRAAKQFFPTTFQAPLHAGLVAESEGHAEEAEREYKEAIARAPIRPEPYSRLGSLYLATGRPEEAVVCFETVLRFTPDDVEARGLLEKARQRAAAKRGAEKAQAPPGV
jgi:tetratricopeptide (TPR) repeat protein